MATIRREGNKIYVLVDNRMRLVGEIIDFRDYDKLNGERTKNDGFCLMVDRNRENHLMITSGSYGFAKEVIDHKDWFDYVLINETSKQNGQQSYLIPRPEIILHGRTMESGGFEKQYFVKLETLKKFKI